MNLRSLLGVLLLGWIASSRTVSAQELSTNEDWRKIWPSENRKEWEGRSDGALQRMADTGSGPARFILWKRWFRSRPVDASKHLATAARQGFAPALLELGEAAFSDYSKPFSVRSNGWHLLVQAATNGYPPAAEQVARHEIGFLEMGFTSENDRWVGGRFPPLDLARGLRLLRLASDEGHSGAHAALALLYSSGIGEPRTAEESPQNLLLRAARAGNAESYRHLADRYLHGHGVERNLLEAARWSYFSHRTRSVGRDLVDPAGNAKQQDTPELRDLAELLALFIAVGDGRKPEAAVALGRRYQFAGDWFQAATLFRLADRWGGGDPEALATAEANLTEPQRRKSRETESFPPEP